MSIEKESENEEVIFEDDSDNKENMLQSKKFEDMNEDELKIEFSKRNMKVGRIKKKAKLFRKFSTKIKSPAAVFFIVHENS